MALCVTQSNNVVRVTRLCLVGAFGYAVCCMVGIFKLLIETHVVNDVFIITTTSPC